MSRPSPRAARALAGALAVLVLAVLGWVLWPDGPAGARPSLPGLGLSGDGPGAAGGQAGWGSGMTHGADDLGPPANAASPEPLRVAEGSRAAPPDDVPRLLVTGTIRDAAGVPLPGARVHVTGGGLVRHAEADATGAFRITLPDDPLLVLRVLCAGHAGTASLGLGRVTGPLDVRLTPLARPVLEVHDDDGLPLAGAAVLLLQAEGAADARPGEVPGWDPETGVWRSTWAPRIGPLGTDELGRARLTTRAGAWQVLPARRADLLRDVASLADAPPLLRQGERVLQLPAGESWASLRATARASLDVTVEPMIPGTRVVLESAAEPAPRLGQVTGAEPVHLADLDPGPWTVRAEAPDGRRASLDLALEPGTPTRVVLALGGSRMRAVVRDVASGLPVDGARVWLWAEPSGPEPRRQDPVPRPPVGLPPGAPAGMSLRHTPAGPPGEVDLGELPPGRYRVWADRPEPPAVPVAAAWLEVPAGDAAVQVGLEVQPAAPLEVWLPDVPARHAGYHAVHVNSADEAFSGMVLAADPGHGDVAVFRTEGLPPGEWGVQVRNNQGVVVRLGRAEVRLGVTNRLELELAP